MGGGILLSNSILYYILQAPFHIHLMGKAYIWIHPQYIQLMLQQ